jgi:carboxymethylenebutenolidase
MSKSQQFSGPLYGYLAKPNAVARAGVLILPTIFGVNAFARGYADMLTDAGFVAAVWDLNSGLPLTPEYEECIKRARTLTDTSAGKMIGQWIDALLADHKLSTIGVVGFCIGGRFAFLQAARDKRITACAAAYPSIESPRLANQELDAVALASEIACPVHMLRPGNDHVSSPETYQALTQGLLRRRAPTTIQTYPEAEHGFMHRPTPEANVAATKLAAPQLLGFFKGCLGG